MSDFQCVKCGGKLECFGGLSAHPDNWTCPKCDRAAMSDTPIRYVVLDGRMCDVTATGFDDSVVPLYVAAKHYNAVRSDLAARDAELEVTTRERNDAIRAQIADSGLRDRAERAEAELAQARLFIAETGYVLRHPMYADEENRDGLAEDCKRFATGEVCAKYLDVKHQTDRAIRAESELADWKASSEKMAARFNEVVAERESWKAKAEALLAHLPDNWGDEVVEGELMLLVDSDAIDAARLKP